MGVTVLKFGGSSVATAALMARVAGIVRDRVEADGPVAVVVSAAGGVTDAIADVLPEAARDEAVVAPFMEDLRGRHEGLLEGLPDDEADAVRAALSDVLRKLERVVYGIAYTQDLTPKVRDLALSFGERLSARVLAGHLRALGVAAEAVDADAAGIVTDEAYGNATPLMPDIEDNVTATLVPRLDEGRVPVVTGFFGVTVDGHVATFGRGGSDFSGAILAAALDADALEVWKDVDGFLTTDPEMVEQAVPVPEMSYEEAAELAYLGVRVLHPRTVEPLAERGIPLRVKNTARPDAPGTLIHDVEARSGKLRAVAVREGLGVLKLYGPGMAATPGIGKRVFALLGDRGINVHNMAASQASFALLVDEANLQEGRRALAELRGGIIQDVDALGGMALVCVVGPDLGGIPGIAGRIFQAVGDAGVNVEMICVGASHIAMNFVVKSEDKERCLTALHKHFLG